MEKGHPLRTRNKSTRQNRGQASRIDVLPDDVLLVIFDHYVYTWPFMKIRDRGTWQTLVHVCRRWRSLVFQSPLRLNLRLHCTTTTPAKDKLDVWPALPLLISDYLTKSSETYNVVAALGQSNRVRQVRFTFGCWKMDVLAAMQVPFPELTELKLTSYDTTVPVIPFSDSFLGGSAPSLRSIELYGIPFPGLPNLLSSATHLVELWLVNIPHSGYISPESVISVISALTFLKTLCLKFESPESSPDRQSRSLPTLNRSTLPAFKKLYFEGTAEYLEELVNGIDTPQLERIYIIFFSQIDFDCPRLAQFINHTPTLRALGEARVATVNDTTTSVVLRNHSGSYFLKISTRCREPDRLSSIEQLCNSSLPTVETVEDLYLLIQDQLVWRNEDTPVLQLLHPFTAVKNLYVSKKSAPGIAATLTELVGGRITEVLPSLQNIFVEHLEPSGPFMENVGRFVAARRLSDHPVNIFYWDGLAS